MRTNKSVKLSVCCLVIVTIGLICYNIFVLEDVLKIEKLPYRQHIAKGIEHHRKHFKWYTSMNGNYCNVSHHDEILNFKSHYSKYNKNDLNVVLESRKRLEGK